MTKVKGFEAAKFALYVTVPVVLTLTVVYSPATLNKIIANRSYVVYPPEAPRPPPIEEILARIDAEKQAK